LLVVDEELTLHDPDVLVEPEI